MNQRDPVHPEQGPDEVYLGSYLRDEFGEICWETARMGRQPHDADGRQMSCDIGAFFPVFIKRTELLDPRGVVGAEFGFFHVS